MYTIGRNIRIRTCDELSFFINIRNNMIYAVKTETLNFLQIQLKNGLSTDSLKQMDKNFAKFVNDLKKQNILENI